MYVFVKLTCKFREVINKNKYILIAIFEKCERFLSILTPKNITCITFSINSGGRGVSLFVENFYQEIFIINFYKSKYQNWYYFLIVVMALDILYPTTTFPWSSVLFWKFWDLYFSRLYTDTGCPPKNGDLGIMKGLQNKKC